MGKTAASAARRAAALPLVRAPPADAGRAALALEAHKRLCAAYRCPIAYFHDHPPLDELVSSLLSHRTRNADSARAFRSLRERFPSWESLANQRKCVSL